jgi:hypothetical protein
LLFTDLKILLDGDDWLNRLFAELVLEVAFQEPRSGSPIVAGFDST